jgi:hypothetical protein
MSEAILPGFDVPRIPDDDGPLLLPQPDAPTSPQEAVPGARDPSVAHKHLAGGSTGQGRPSGGRSGQALVVRGGFGHGLTIPRSVSRHRESRVRRNPLQHRPSHSLTHLTKKINNRERVSEGYRGSGAIYLYGCFSGKNRETVSAPRNPLCCKGFDPHKGPCGGP